MNTGDKKIGISVNVGLNKVNSTVFSAQPLKGCENDAQAMFNIAKTRGFDMDRSKLLLGAEATHEAVSNAVAQAAEVLKPGDLFFFSFAGHGTFRILNSGSEEADNHDESIVLSDHLMIDNYWRKQLWPRFKPGVRVVAIADCCHSETTLFALPIPPAIHAESAGIAGNAVARTRAPLSAVGVAEGVTQKDPSGKPGIQTQRFRMITQAERQKELVKHQLFYNEQSAAPPQEIKATRLFLSACQDDQKAADGEVNGAFTAALLNVWNNGNFSGNYKDLMTKVEVTINRPNQTPKLTQIGGPDLSWEKPFTIETAG
jgi:uncharacterized caspase-like protein